MSVGSGFMGMDVQGINRVVGSLNEEAEHIETILRSLTASLTNTAWAGHDRDVFVQDWNNMHAVAIRRAVDDLRSTAGQVKANVQMQITTSGH